MTWLLVYSLTFLTCLFLTILGLRLIQGSRLDSYARYSLWEGGLDYRHGTGHGVGAFLNVHEGNLCLV